MSRFPRRAAAVVIAASAAVALVSCSSDDSGDGAAGGGDGAQAQETNMKVTSPPAFTGADERLTGMAQEGCGAPFEEWATDAVVFFTDINGGDWENVQVEFAPGQDTAQGNKTCEIHIAGAAIADTPGGDLNDATVTVMGLPTPDNPYDKALSTQIFMDKHDNSTLYESGFDDVIAVDGLSPLSDEALNHATARGLLEDSNIRMSNERRSRADAFFFGDDTAMSVTFDVINYPPGEEGEATDADGGAWVAVETGDQQIDQDDTPARNAAGHLAQVMTRVISNQVSVDSADFWKI